MADEKPPVQKAVELFVYAPVGAAFYVRDMLPSMVGIFVARGKREVQSHRTPPAPPTPPVPPEVKRRIDESVGVARYVAEGGLGVAREVAGTALSQFLAMRANGTDTTGAATSAPATSGVEPTVPEGDKSEVRQRGAVPPDAAWHTDVPPVDALPIPDYDELSASQVVERLEGLDHESLDAVRRYESGHRGRNTILGKIAQLS